MREHFIPTSIDHIQPKTLKRCPTPMPLTLKILLSRQLKALFWCSSQDVMGWGEWPIGSGRSSIYFKGYRSVVKLMPIGIWAYILVDITDRGLVQLVWGIRRSIWVPGKTSRLKCSKALTSQLSNLSHSGFVSQFFVDGEILGPPICPSAIWDPYWLKAELLWLPMRLIDLKYLDKASLHHCHSTRSPFYARRVRYLTRSISTGRPNPL